jgi:Methyltransferase domain.
MSAKTQSQQHEFKGSWRWPKKFESWVSSHVKATEGRTANIFAGLSPLCDVRVDLKNPVELIKNLQNDTNTDLRRARKCLQDFVIGDVDIEPLYNAEDPTDHELADKIKISNTIKTDALNKKLPFDDNSFTVVVSDPPWKELTENYRTHIFEELVRITKPGGTIIFNGYWTPTGQLPITVDYVDYRQDLERSPQGTPNISWVSQYTVHDTVDTARHLSRTLGQDYEFTPSSNSFEQTVKAERVYELTHIHNIPHRVYDSNIINPVSDLQCPQCDCTQIDPVGGNITDTHAIGELYQCVDCGFRATKSEINEDTTEERQKNITQF